MEPIVSILERLPRPERVSKTSTTTVEQVCPDCKDVGWLRTNAEPGDPQFGQLMPCACGLVQNRRLARLDEQFGFGGLAKVDLAGLKSLKGQRQALEVARAYAGEPKGWLYLHGAYGDGKTTLMAGIVNAARRAGIESIFVVVPELLDWLRACFQPGSGRNYEEDFSYIRAVPLLALDDLGTEKDTDWARERLYEIFNWRYRQELATIVTSNNPPSELGDGRLASRFGDVMLSKVVYLGEVDVRAVQR